jgi:uncharacterized protein YggU (UPF0235/DUF167 family)
MNLNLPEKVKPQGKYKNATKKYQNNTIMYQEKIINKSPNNGKINTKITQLLTKPLLIMKKKNKKTVKLQSKYRPSVKSFRGYKEVPWLTISGNWLANIGFSIGSVVEIITGENQLIIKKL